VRIRLGAFAENSVGFEESQPRNPLTSDNAEPPKLRSAAPPAGFVKWSENSGNVLMRVPGFAAEGFAVVRPIILREMTRWYN